MPPKRPIQNVFGNDDDDSGVSQPLNGTPPKKPRPDSRSTLQRAGVAPQNGAPTSAPAPAPAPAPAENSIQAQVAAAKARAQALMSAMQNKGQIPTPRPAAAPPATSASSRFAPMASARPPPTPVTAYSAARPPAGGASSIQAQLEAARAKVQAQMAALQSKNKVAPTPSTSSVAAPVPAPSSSSTSSAQQASSSKAPTGIHPLLLSNDLPYKLNLPSSSSSSTTTAKSSSFIKGRSTNVPPEANPYLQASRAAAEEAAKSAEGPKQRSMHKGFQFHRPGRHILEAEELRREQQMEEIKRRIEESARKAGMQDELGGDEKRLVRQPPPEVEWWDVNLLRSCSYDDVPDDLSVSSMIEQAKTDADFSVKLYGNDSPIDHYVQHPIPIPAPSDKFEVQPKGLMLTKHEQRKLRRQRRAAELQDKRDRIKMGLLPPEPPKVKLSNLMRVLTSEAVSDPTKIEARVRREIAARKEQHERQNAERKLTDEQRRQKKEWKKEADEKKGLFTQVYRVRHLVSPRHKLKVRRNAVDHALTGVCVFHPSMALVVVEGSAKALKAYKRLMTVRIDWKDPGQPREDDDDDEGAGKEPQDANANNVPVGGFRLLTTSQEDVNWAENECELIFEGPIRERNWKGRGFRAVAAETDARAREVLGERMQGYWDVAKRVTSSQADVI